MFHAFIVSCLTMQPAVCVRFDDTRGPYDTMEACTIRIVEMLPIAMIMSKQHFHDQLITGKGICDNSEKKGILV
jgi:hypothetical protein